jgi:hypothetical protein
VTHLGLQLPSFTFRGVPNDRMFERIAETALAAEASGFDSFWVMDHYHQIANIGPETDPMLEAYTARSSASAPRGTRRSPARAQHPAAGAAERTEDPDRRWRRAHDRRASDRSSTWASAA